MELVVLLTVIFNLATAGLNLYIAILDRKRKNPLPPRTEKDSKN